MSTSNTTATIANAINRRDLLRGMGAAGVATLLGFPGCGNFPPESGAAFEPWMFPADETRPEMIAAAAAIIAASPHNTQPWLLSVTPAQIDVWAANERSLGAMDPTRREMHIGLGCAVENLAIAARQHGRDADVAWMPSADDPQHVARIALSPADPVADPLYDVIALRHTNRGRYLDEPAPPELELELARLIDDASVALRFFASDAARRSFATHTIAATEAIVADTEMSEASHHWYRHTAAEIDEHRNGITVDTLGLGATTRVLAKSQAYPSAETAGEYWLAATRTTHTTAGAFCLLATPDRSDRVMQLRCGRVYQRMHLWATSVGLAMHPLNQMAERQDREAQLDLEPTFTEILDELVADATMGAQMLFRVGYPWDDAVSSPRMPIDWVTR